jgi:carboxyl-terminal processing protease
MTKTRTNLSSKISKHVANRDAFLKNMPASFKLIILAATLGVGYIAGVYHYQIESAIKPIIGVKVTGGGELDFKLLQDTYRRLATKFDGSLNKQALIEGANAGMVSALGDNYTMYMNKTESKAFDDALSGNIGSGIGAEISLRGGNVTIVRVLADNAAIKAGLLAGDTVLKINDTSTAGYSVDRAVKLIRGDEGTTVKLTILRGSETKDYTVTRATINNPSVYSTVVDDVGIITITRFDAETGVLAKTAAQGLIKQGAKSVILDLRDNGGGYVDAAVDVASLWLENKVIVTERVGNTVKETLKSGNSAILKNLPTIVLVNGSSASASEIVSGALQDYKVAKLVGTKTFGKGSVQELINLDDGSTLKVTVARWYTPNGRNINKDGINPDSIVEMTEANLNAGIDTQMDKAKDLLKQ